MGKYPIASNPYLELWTDSSWAVGSMYLHRGLSAHLLGPNFGPIPERKQPPLFPISCLIFLIKKSKENKQNIFRDFFYLSETMIHIRMILRHLCLSGMPDIIQSKITWFWGYSLLPLLCSKSLISPNFGVKSIIFFPILARSLFPKLLENALLQSSLYL